MPTLYAKTYNSDGFNQHYLQQVYMINKSITFINKLNKMKKTTFKTSVERLPEQSELYILTLKTYNQEFTLKVDKENLRDCIEKIDNQII